jgi:phage shock protein A
MRNSGRPSKTKGKSIKSWQIIAIATVLGALRFGPQVAAFIPVEPPSLEIKQLADATTMTPEAQQIFYRQTPTIQPKAAFSENCPQSRKLDEGQFLLGCYVHDGESGKIVIESIPDARFKGMMESIAAHEMLHAAYSRLSSSERDFLAPRLKKASQRVTDRHLAKILKKYEDTDGELFVNELHSHLGTELGDLGDAKLEQHYRRYFVDRHRVVALAQGSKAAMHKLEDQGDQLKSEIDVLDEHLKSAKQDLKARKQNLADYRQNLDVLNADLMQFKAQAEQADRQGSSWANAIEQFEQKKSYHNQQVREYNLQVQQFQEQVDQFNQQVDRYNQKIKAYNEVTHEKRSLLAEIDSTPTDKQLAR